MSYAWQHNNIGGGDGGGGRGFDDAEDDAKDLLQPAAASSKGKGKDGKDVNSNEKLFRIINYLQVNARTKAMTLQEIGGKLQLDLSPPEIADSLNGNEKIDVTLKPDRETREFRYISDFPTVKDQDTLGEMINSSTGVTAKAVEDDRCYPEVAEDIKELIRRGQILAVKNEDTAKQASTILHPRGIRFMVGLGGEKGACAGTLSPHEVRTVQDLRAEVRRGDAVGACAIDSAAVTTASPSRATWFRVSSTLVGAQRQWAQAPPSVSSVKELGKDRQDALDQQAKLQAGSDDEGSGKPKDLWAEPFNDKQLPLDVPTAAVEGSVTLFKFGCTNDVRRLWKETLSQVPSDDTELEKRMGLGAGAGQQRPKRKQQQQRRRAPRKMKRVTNTHLDG